MQRILVCLDDSTASRGVLLHAEALRLALHASLIPFRAIRLPYERQTVADILRSDPDNVIECWRRDALEAVEVLVAHLPLAFREPAYIAVGTPWKEMPGRPRACRGRHRRRRSSLPRA